MMPASPVVGIASRDAHAPLSVRHVMIDGIRTGYVDVGEGPVVVLFHSGEFGASGVLCWEATIPALAHHHRVVAPDWLGFGSTDKLYDFGGGRARRIQHMRRFLETLCIDEAVFMGSSMGGSVLASVLAEEPNVFPATAAVLSSGGGFAPDNDARRVLLAYDGTVAAMRDIIGVIFHDPAWAADEDYIARRNQAATAPGAWEAVAAARYRSPVVEPRSDFGQKDRTPYENISVPVLVVAGADDPLRQAGYADEIAGRIPRGTALTYSECAHMPHLEHADDFNRDVLEFLGEALGPRR